MNHIIALLNYFTLLVLIGEALILSIVTLLIKKGTAWNTRKNNIILFTDILLGGWLLFSYSGCFSINLLDLITAIILVLTHAYRTVEYFIKSEYPFCFNPALLIVNVLKLGGLLFFMGNTNLL